LSSFVTNVYFLKQSARVQNRFYLNFKIMFVHGETVALVVGVVSVVRLSLKIIKL
jgi:hypothetical protein